MNLVLQLTRLALSRCIPECATDEDTFHSVLRVARERERESKRERQGETEREGGREREREGGGGGERGREKLCNFSNLKGESL